MKDEMKRRKEKLIEAKSVTEKLSSESSEEEEDGAMSPPPRKRWCDVERDDMTKVLDHLRGIVRRLDRMDGRLDRMDGKMEKRDEEMRKMMSAMERVSQGGSVSKLEVKEEANEQEFHVGSINLMRLSAPTPYVFALAACDVLFTKEELASSLMFSSKKSVKPALDPKRVQVLLNAMEKKFGQDGWDLKVLKAKVNQKCRDSITKL